MVLSVADTCGVVADCDLLMPRWLKIGRFRAHPHHRHLSSGVHASVAAGTKATPFSPIIYVPFATVNPQFNATNVRDTPLRNESPARLGNRCSIPELRGRECTAYRLGRSPTCASGGWAWHQLVWGSFALVTRCGPSSDWSGVS